MVSAKPFTPSSHIDNLHSHPRIFTIAHRNLDDVTGAPLLNTQIITAPQG